VDYWSHDGWFQDMMPVFAMTVSRTGGGRLRLSITASSVQVHLHAAWRHGPQLATQASHSKHHDYGRMDVNHQGRYGWKRSSASPRAAVRVISSF
jgi:hypothetical protein